MNNITDNFILNADSYKLSHFGFEDPGTTKMMSYIEARNGGEYAETIFFGFQYFIQYLTNVRITMGMIDQAERLIKSHGLPFNRAGWEYIANEKNGRLPLKIKAVKEGTLVPTGNVLVTIENTDPRCAWLTSYVETAALRAVWYPTTVATRAFKFRQLIHKYLVQTGDGSLTPYKFLDFGARGVSSKESSGIGGVAHQTSFEVTDNILGMATAVENYFHSIDEAPCASIPASEHTVTISWSKDREREFYEHALETYGGEGKMVSIVCDTYSMENALRIWGTELKDKVINSGGTVVIRPDSGNPVEQVLLTVETLDKYFGSTVNAKGYKVLHPSVRVIQADGITLPMTEDIFKTLTEAGYSADNLTLGCGGYLLQDLTRDTCRFAMKGCYAEVNGEARNIKKEVATDPTKASKSGQLTLVRNRYDHIATIEEKDLFEGDEVLLDTVFSDGICMRNQTLKDIREIVAQQ